MYIAKKKKKRDNTQVKKIFVKEVGTVANVKLSAEEYNILKA